MSLDPITASIYRRTAVDWRDATHESEVERLDVLLAGDPRMESPDLLGGKRMARLLEEARKDYDVVVVDLPALEGAPDTECVAPLLDGILLLCDEGRGPTCSQLVAAITRLRATGSRMLGVVRRPRRWAA